MSVAAILKAKGPHVETTQPDATIHAVVWNMRVKGIGALVVSVDGATVLGLVSERDIIHALAEHGSRLLSSRVADLVTRPVVTCAPEESLTAVMARMTHQRVRHLPVVERGKLCGIVSIGDVVKQRLEELKMEANILRENLMASH